MNVVMNFGEHREDLDAWCSKNEAYYLTVKSDDSRINYFQWYGSIVYKYWYAFVDIDKNFDKEYSKLMIIDSKEKVPPDNIFDLCNDNICVYMKKNKKENAEYSKLFYNFKISEDLWFDTKLMVVDKKWRCLFDSMLIFCSDPFFDSMPAPARGLINYFVRIFDVPVREL
jgi:hypothetical protein